MSSKIFFCGEEENSRESEDSFNFFDASQTSILVQLGSKNLSKPAQENASIKSLTSASSNSETSDIINNRGQAYSIGMKNIQVPYTTLPIDRRTNQLLDLRYQVCQPNLYPSLYSNYFNVFSPQLLQPSDINSKGTFTCQDFYIPISSGPYPDLLMQANGYHQNFSYYNTNNPIPCSLQEESQSKFTNCQYTSPKCMTNDIKGLQDQNKATYNSIEDFIMNCKYPIEFINNLKGSRHIQKLLEENEEKAFSLFRFLQQVFDKLLLNVYGNYVCKKIFSLIKAKQRLFVWDFLTDNLQKYSENQHSTFCIQMLITQSESDSEKSMVEHKIAPYFQKLVLSEHGVSVMLALLSVSDFKVKSKILLKFLLCNFPSLCVSSNSALLCKALVSKCVNSDPNNLLKRILIRKILPSFNSLILNEISNVLLVQMLEDWGINECDPIIQIIYQNFVTFSLNPTSCPVILKLLEILEYYVS